MPSNSALDALLDNARAVARMKHPSIEHILRARGFGYEADRIAALVESIETLDQSAADGETA